MDVGFYSLQQLASQAETEKQKGRAGVFPLSEMTIRRMWTRGEFPKPVKYMNRNVWGKEVINSYANLIKQGVALAEAAVRAEAAGV